MYAIIRDTVGILVYNCVYQSVCLDYTILVGKAVILSQPDYMAVRPEWSIRDALISGIVLFTRTGSPLSGIACVWLQGNTSLNELNLSYNELGNEAGRRLGDALSRFRIIKED